MHGCGFYALWLWEHDWLRGLVWDRTGTNMLAGTLSWLSGCALWFTSLEYVRRNYFEVGTQSCPFTAFAFKCEPLIFGTSCSGLSVQRFESF